MSSSSLGFNFLADSHVMLTACSSTEFPRPLYNYTTPIHDDIATVDNAGVILQGQGLLLRQAM